MDYLKGMSTSQRVAFAKLRRYNPRQGWRYETAVANGNVRLTSMHPNGKYETWYMLPHGELRRQP